MSHGVARFVEFLQLRFACSHGSALVANGLMQVKDQFGSAWDYHIGLDALLKMSLISDLTSTHDGLSGGDKVKVDLLIGPLEQFKETAVNPK
jgi:hypothetical protein